MGFWQKDLPEDVSSNTFTFRFVVRAAGWMLAPLVCGCLPAAAPLPSLPQTPAANNLPEKGQARAGPAPVPAQNGAAAADKPEPPGARGLMLHGGWHRIGLSVEESASGVYEEALAKLEKSGAGAATFRYRHAGLEEFMAGPAARRLELPELLADSDHNVAATAAVALARQGDARAAPRLAAAIDEEQLPLPARCAAVEALGLLPGDSQVATLQKLADRYGQFAPGASAGYQADLHAELLRALARHVDAGDDPRFLAAVEVPSPLVRIEALRAWAAGSHGSMPNEVVDLRSSDDARVRAAAMKALAARKHPQACDFLTLCACKTSTCRSA